MNELQITCPYCDKEAELVTGKVIYPNNPELIEKKYWLCKPCWAYVGTHIHSKIFKPLGRLADKELRVWKCRAHASFDRLWNGLDTKGLSLTKRRRAAYAALAEELNVKKRDCHIGWLNVDQCKEVIKVCPIIMEKLN